MCFLRRFTKVLNPFKKHYYNDGFMRLQFLSNILHVVSWDYSLNYYYLKLMLWCAFWDVLLKCHTYLKSAIMTDLCVCISNYKVTDIAAGKFIERVSQANSSNDYRGFTNFPLHLAVFLTSVWCKLDYI